MAINLALHPMDSGCSPDLKQTPLDQVIMDSNLSWGCFFILFLFVVSPKTSPLWVYMSTTDLSIQDAKQCSMGPS